MTEMQVEDGETGFWHIPQLKYIFIFYICRFIVQLNVVLFFINVVE